MSNIPDAEDTKSHVVYRCYDAKDQLLYIGCTRDLDYRMTLHDPLVIREMVRLETESHPNRLEARAAERYAIRTESPLLNKQHNPTRFKKKTGGGYAPVEPVHPLTAELIRRERPVTQAEMRDALQRVADLLGIGETPFGGAA